MLDNITREYCKSRIWSDFLDGAEHAVLKTRRRITFVLAKQTGWRVVVSRLIFLRIRSCGLSSAIEFEMTVTKQSSIPAAQNGIRTISARSGGVLWVDVQVAVLHHLDRLFAAGSWSFCIR